MLALVFLQGLINPGRRVLRRGPAELDDEVGELKEAFLPSTGKLHELSLRLGVGQVGGNPSAENPLPDPREILSKIHDCTGTGKRCVSRLMLCRTAAEGNDRVRGLPITTQASQLSCLDLPELLGPEKLVDVPGTAEGAGSIRRGSLEDAIVQVEEAQTASLRKETPDGALADVFHADEKDAHKAGA